MHGSLLGVMAAEGSLLKMKYFSLAQQLTVEVTNLCYKVYSLHFQINQQDINIGKYIIYQKRT